MSQWNKVFQNTVVFSLLISCILIMQSSTTMAQTDIAGYRYVERTVWEKRPVTVVKEVEETVFEKKQVTTYKHVWNTEKREKRTTVKKPVTRTTFKEERTVVQKPITETKYREKRIEETSYDLVTELQEQEYTVQKPVIETQYRDEQVNVRQKITEDLIEVKNETVYKPKTIAETAYVPTNVVVNKTVAAPALNSRPRMEWLAAGYYTDPTTGQQVWRRRGFHWTQPTVAVPVAESVPTLVPTTVEKTTLVPETVTTRRPVEVSRYEDRVETRRVPYEVEKMVDETMIRQVPVTVKKPVTKTTVERVPYEETRYVDEVVVNKIPIEETVYQEVTEVEPYEVEVSRWVPVTEEIEVPKTIVKKVETQEMREMPRTILMKVPVDKNGNFLGTGEPVSDDELESRSRYSAGYGTTDRNSGGRYRGVWESEPAGPETSERASSVLVPETAEPAEANRDMVLQPIQRSPKEASQPSNANKAESDREGLNGNGEEADRAPALDPSVPNASPVENSTNNRQDADQIAGLQVLRRPAIVRGDLPSSMPELGRPSVEPNHADDVLAAERQ